MHRSSHSAVTAKGWMPCLLALSLLLNILHMITWRSLPPTPAIAVSQSATAPARKTFLFIAIGSAPGYEYRRNEIRRTWLTWTSRPDKHAYKFFTDRPRGDPALVEALDREQSKYGDLVFLPTEPGRVAYGRRGMMTVKWANENYSFQYLMKTDDDSFPCLELMTRELETRPRKRFAWGKYWYRKTGSRRNRMDENLMILSQDIVQLIAGHGEMLAFDGALTFAINFAYWTHFMNLTIFDDRDRIDSQQGYLTTYMHLPFDKELWTNGTYAQFCQTMIYAHHVHPGIMDAVFTAGQQQAITENQWEAANITLPRKKPYIFDLSTRGSGRLPKCTCTSLVTTNDPDRNV